MRVSARLVAVCTVLVLCASRPAKAQEPAIEEIEVNQVLGRARLADGTLAAVTKFVAGKETVVRVRLSGPVAVDSEGKTQTLEVSRGGETVVVLDPQPASAPASVLTFRCPTLSACGGWAEGTYAFAAIVGGATGTRSGVKFAARRPLRILAVPMKNNYGGVIVVPDDKWKKGGRFTRDVYPVGVAGFRYELRPELDLSAPEYDLTTENGRRAVWEALTQLVPPSCTTSPQSSGCWDAVVGFMKSRIPYGEGALQGYTYGPPASTVVNDDGDMPATIAHEIAHLYGIGDEYKGGSFRCAVNAPPATYSGRDWDTGETVSCTQSTSVAPVGPAEGSLVLGAEDLPYEIGGRGPLGNKVSYMGSNFPEPEPQKIAWTTWPIYSWLFDRFTPFPPPPPPAERRASYRVADVSMRVWKDGRVDFLPWSSYAASSAPEARTGSYSVEAVDASGTLLASQGFTPGFLVRSNPPREIDPAPVEDVPLLLPAATRKVRVLRGGALLAEKPVSASAPVVQLVSPAGSGRRSGPLTISWTASDADGDPLEFDVEYSEDGQTWEVLASGLKATSHVEDLDDWPGGPAVRVRVLASDGFNTTAAESAPFEVPEKSPEVLIDEPIAGEALAAGEETWLEGSAFDLQDGELVDDSELAWRSSRDGDLGRGSALSLEGLTPGTHVLTLTATNSRGRSASASIGVSVVAAGAPETPLAASFVPAVASPRAGQPVRFDDTSVGEPDERLWTFGDGATSTEETPEHAFAAAGTWDVTLRVTADGASATTTRKVVVRPADDGDRADLFVPVVLRLQGLASSDYSTELTLTNRGTSRARVSFTWVATQGGGSGTLDGAETIEGGRQLVIPDAVAYLRQKGLAIAAEGARLGTLRVVFTGLSSSQDASVLARTTTPVPTGGRAGLAYPGVAPAQLFSAAPVFVTGLRQDSRDRSAVAVQNAGGSGDGDVTVRLTFVAGDGADAGRALGSADVTLPPGGFAQSPLTSIVPGLSGRQGHVRAERVSGSAPWYAYGVVNDQVTSDGSFLVPVSARVAGPALGVTLPAVVDTGRFVTEVVLTNLGSRARTLRLTYASANLPSATVSATVTLGAGAQLALETFVGWLRGQVAGIGSGPFAGPLFVTVPGDTVEGIAVSGRTWNRADEADPAKGYFGVFYGGVGYGASSTGTLFLAGLRQDDANRSNVALVNPAEDGAEPVTVRLDVFDGATGAKSGEVVRTLVAREFLQLNAVLSGFPGVSKAHARVVRVSGEGPFIAYGVINDGSAPGQGSGDGAFVPGEVPAP